MTEIDYNLLGKILAKEANDEEKNRFAEWLSLSDENRETFRTYRVFYDKSVITEFHGKDKPVGKQGVVGKSGKSRYYLVAAASVSLIMVISFIFFSRPMEQPIETQLVENNTVVKFNPKGQKSRIILPDGSTVWLNSNSKLQYNEVFTGSSRTVKLEGEAFFEVARDSARLFVVETGDLTVNVLGTSFNISNFGESKSAIVSLITGKLMVSLDDKEEMLLPGSQLQYFKNNSKLVVSNNDNIEKNIAWKNGILIFEREDFHSVISQLERWYDVNITLSGNPSGEWRFTGYFDNEYLKNVLEVLSYGKNFNYKIEGKHVTLSTH